MSAIEQDPAKMVAALQADIKLLRTTIDRMVEVRMAPRAVRETRDRCFERLDGPAFVASDPWS